MSIINWFKSKFQKFDNKAFIENPEESSPSTNYTETKSEFEDKFKERFDEVKEKAGEFTEKAKEFIGETSKEVMHQGSEMLHEIKEKFDILDENTREFRGKIMDKAQEGYEKVQDWVDKTIESGKAKDASELEKDNDQDGLADTPPDFGKTIAEKHTGFFEKAEKFLEEKENTPSMSASEQESNSNSGGLKPTLDLPKEDHV